MTGAVEAHVGVDLGTQGVRAVVVTDDGQTLGHGAAALASDRDGPRHEQDPDAWWGATCAAVGEAMAAARHAVPALQVGAVAVDGTSGTFVLLDGHGQAVAPASMYDDARGGGELDWVNEVGADAWAAAGYRRMQHQWALPRLLWSLRQPGAERAVRLVHQTDAVNRALVGHEVATDTSSALKTGADLAGVRWPVDVMDTLGVPADLLPDVVLPGAVLGTVCADAAEATGLPIGTTVVAGATDGCAAQLGAGAVAAGSCNAVLGTTLVLKAVSPTLVHDPTGVVYSHRSADGRWLPGGASSTGAAPVAAELGGEDLDRLSEGVDALLPGADVRYPLSGRGERFPFVAPDAEGFTLAGPDRGGVADGPVRTLASIVLGVALVERLCLDYLDLLGVRVDGDLVLTGGATRNEVWNRLRADVLGRQVVLPTSAEPATGMAVLAASTATGRSLVDTAGAMVRRRAVVDPTAGRRAALDDQYLRLVAALEERGWLPADTARHARGRTS